MIKREIPEGDDKTVGAPTEVLANILEVLKYLQKAGWKISQAQLYRHRNQHKIRQKRGGGFTLAEVSRYAVTHLQQVDGATPPPDPVLTEEKALEMRRARAETEIAELKLATRTKDLVTGPLEQALAARLLLLRSDYENFIHSRAGAIVACVGGDPARTPELVALLEALGETWLGRYAGDTQFSIDASGAVTPPFDAVGIPAYDITFGQTLGDLQGLEIKPAAGDPDDDELDGEEGAGQI